MTLLVFVASTAVAALGTRLAALGFAAAAGMAVVRMGPDASIVVATTWTAAAAAAAVAFGGPPRRTAVAAAGAAAVLIAGSGTNAAAVLLAWTVGTAAATLSEGARGIAGRRRAVSLLAADVFVAAAVCYGAISTGFVDWTVGLPTPARLLLLAGAVARIPLMGSMRPETGIVLVRAQTLVLVAFALPTASTSTLELAVVGGVVLFAAAGSARGGVVRDGGQEIGLVVATTATAVLGWMPMGWAWGAAAGGTLMHSLRLRAGRSERVEVVSTGFGSPLLPAAMALVVGAASARGGVAAVVVVSVAIGFGTRASFGVRRATQMEGQLEGWASVVAGGLALVAGLWATVLSLPRPPAGGVVPWPPAWAVATAVVAGLVGWRTPTLAPERPKRRVQFGGWREISPMLARPLMVARSRWGVIAPLTALALVSVGLWAAGFARGFL